MLRLGRLGGPELYMWVIRTYFRRNLGCFSSYSDLAQPRTFPDFFKKNFLEYSHGTERGGGSLDPLLGIFLLPDQQFLVFFAAKHCLLTQNAANFKSLCKRKKYLARLVHNK